MSKKVYMVIANSDNHYSVLAVLKSQKDAEFEASLLNSQSREILLTWCLKKKKKLKTSAIVEFVRKGMSFRVVEANLPEDTYE